MTTAPLIQELVRLRRSAGLTQADVASRLGTSQPVIARLEAGGRDPRLSTVQRYASSVGADLVVLQSPGSDPGSAARLTGRIRARLATAAPVSAVFREVVQFIDDSHERPDEELTEAVRVEPLSTGDRRWDAVVAAAVDWLATNRALQPPRWVGAQRWKLPAPGWVVSPHERLHQIIRSSTPDEFARHGVYVDASSLESV